MMRFPNASPDARHPMALPSAVAAASAIDPAGPANEPGAPPRALQLAMLRASVSERREIAQQVAWITHMMAADSREERHSARADVVTQTLPLARSAAARVWRVRFAHLCEAGKAADVAGELVKWCKAARSRSEPAWRWFALPGEPFHDPAAYRGTPLREWPAPVVAMVLSLSRLRGANLSDLSLPAGDLRGIVADGTHLAGVNGNGAWWSGASLRNAGFDHSHQVDADFESADLRGAVFSAADLTRARLFRADLRGATLQDTVMRDANLGEAKCQGLTFRRVRLDEASFQRARLHGASFEGGSARGMRLTAAQARQTRWTAMAMPQCNACGADLRGAEFRECDLTGWQARGAKLTGASWVACDLRGARFCGARLTDVRLGAGCNLAGTQWQGARLRLDAHWLRSLPPEQLDKVARSWMTLPADAPALRADVFAQLLRAISAGPVLGADAARAPALPRLPLHVQCSEWLGRLLTAGGDVGGVGDHDAFAGLRRQWLTRTLRRLAEVKLTGEQAAWILPALMATLETRCNTASPAEVRALAAPMCQALFWAGEGAGGIGAARARRLRAAWFGALPAPLHAALSLDGVDAFDPSFVLLTNGDVALRVPTRCLAMVFDARHAALPATVPDLHWLGARAVARNAVRAVRAVSGHSDATDATDASDDFLPATPSQVHALLRESGCLADLWPTQRSLDGFVRLLGRWVGAALASDAHAIIRNRPHPAAGSPAPWVQAAPSEFPLAIAERFDATVRREGASMMPWLRREAHRDIEEVFSHAPRLAEGGGACRDVSISRGAWLAALAGGLAWLSTQPDRPAKARGAPGGTGISSPNGARQALYRSYALALLNESMAGLVGRPGTTGTGAAAPMAEVEALRGSLAASGADAVSPEQLGAHLLGWLASSPVRGLRGLADACRHTLPWDWAMRLPLPPATLRRVIEPRPLPPDGERTDRHRSD
ncbi:pentapeptide repeat-containing protein [Pandoraea sp. CB10b_02]|uniref:pentapeptide repeat-containing protein n=1 Tax=Pandoraea sp. CB10b_02 TaxID=2014535 RepID=UPI00257DAA84|nr:pentapeptide repeat-containing protein [Pandoraea sp. CB10b_02]